ncbi:ATP-binding protein [Sphaerisporangium corydalis]|uniref:ATP-binding protein n=1 Tax=Sphaerisporangium corydalis TaxID=1441875 RepID=A0ABV9EJP5_9ACTN|nr:ATP-binding protein [Sphaerisporangium corydalis]
MRAGSLLGVTDLIGSPESVSLARDYVRQKLGANHPALDNVVLLTSEVVTNACIHSNSREGGVVTLAIADCIDRIEVDVVDAGGETVPHVCGDMFAEGGRGLMLVETISCKWGVYEDKAGRSVWFQVAYEPDSPAGSLTCPRPRTPSEPTKQDNALQRTAKLAAQTVAKSVDLDQ